MGFTTRHLKERIDEHLKKDKKSHILKHLDSSIECNEEASENSFKVIDRANTDNNSNQFYFHLFLIETSSLLASQIFAHL